MKMKALLCSEKGSIPVLVALSLTALFGFSALAVDFGMLASNKQQLQNAADASALAAAADLGTGNSSRIADTAKKYCRDNGFDPDSSAVTMELATTLNTVTVTLHDESTMGFSTVLTGVRTRTVSATATAEAVSIFGGCPYAMFAGQRIEDEGAGIYIGGNNIQINGNIHSNSDITMLHAVLSPGSVATAVRNVVPQSSGWKGNSIALDMPSYRSFESALGEANTLVEFSGNITKNSKGGFQSLIDEALNKYSGNTSALYMNGLYIHISGSLTFNGNSSTAYTAPFPVVLIVDDSITLNGAPLESSEDYPFCIMSKNGNITVDGGGATMTGIIYAPNGNITLNGNNATFVGQLVAQNIRKNGGKITVTYYDGADRFLPKTKVHLIQ